MPLKKNNRNNVSYQSIFDLLDQKFTDIELREGQKEIVQLYNENSSEQDVSIELPTGYGKTLLGGLIAEHNRLKYNNKVVYCCATRHLAAQTKKILDNHGIESVQMTGSSRNFYQSDENLDYQRKKAFVVTTYSHIFNTNPYFEDADIIIFDDAHAAEYAINSMWSLQINKEEANELFDHLYTLLNEFIANFKFKLATRV